MENEPRSPIQKMLTIEQVLNLIPVSRATLFNMERDGRFPKGFFISPNRKVWLITDIAEWQRNLPTETVKHRRGNNSGAGHRGGRRPRGGWKPIDVDLT